MIPVAIIGAGPAGLMAALQLKRCNIPALLLESGRVGGLLHNANRVENYPGFPGGLQGAELVRRFEAQAQSVGVIVTHDEVHQVDYDGVAFSIHSPGQIWKARRVIVASGTKPVAFPTGLVQEGARSRVYYEVAPLLGIHGCSVAIVGAGDAAFDYALNLAQDNDVTILNRSQKISCLPLLWQRAGESEHIFYRENIQIEALDAVPQGLSLVLHDLQGISRVDVDYLVGALGRTPQLDFLSPRVMAQKEQLETGGLLFFIGDVSRGRYRQTAIAVGDGMLAAMKIIHAIQEE